LKKRHDPGQNSKGPVADFVIIYLYYIHMYLGHEYTFPQLPNHSQRIHGNNLEPRNDHHTILSNVGTPFLESCSYFPLFSWQCNSGSALRIFEKCMNMIWIYCDLDYLNIHLYTGLTNNPLAYHCHIIHQHLAPVFWGKNKMIGQQRDCMVVVAKFFSFEFFSHMLILSQVLKTLW